MKPNKPIVLACIAAIALLLSLGSCSQQNMPDDQRGSPLSIRVVDGGYRSDSAPAQPGLGSQDNDDYTTQFTAGDQIGVYAVKGGAVVDGIQNLKLTAAGVGSDIAWQADGGQLPLSLDEGVSYYAYYPYQATPAAQPTLSATDAAGFFKSLIDAWTPDKDQSTQALYTASDLMVSKGKVANSTLTFTMDHQMALAILDFLPKITRYHFTNTDPVIEDYLVQTAPASTPLFNGGFVPWHTKDYDYRYLINPTDEQKKGFLKGDYESSSEHWQCPLTNMTKNQHHTFSIGDKELTINFLLQPGDFLLKDGTLLAKGTSLSDEQKAAVRAVVVKAGRDPSDDIEKDKYTMKKDGKPMTVHGYAVALFDANNEHPNWTSNKTEAVETIANENDFMGYYNTQKIKEYANNHQQDMQTNYPACYWTAEDYENKYPAPDNSSGWFFPSVGQLKYACDNQDAYTSSIIAARGLTWEADSNYAYWSSSEFNDGSARLAWAMYFSNVTESHAGKYEKYTGGCVRALLAF